MPMDAPTAASVADWTTWGLATGPLTPEQRSAVEAGIRDCYRLASVAMIEEYSPDGLAVPEVLWVPSPSALHHAAEWDSPQRDRRPPAVNEIASAALDGPTSCVRAIATDRAIREHRTAVATPVREATTDVLWDAIGESTQYAVSAGFGGRLNAPHFAEMAAYRGELAPRAQKEHDALLAASAAGPWWPFEGLAIVCDLPVVLATTPTGLRTRRRLDDVQWSDGTTRDGGKQ